jgi:hypothetical protein
MKFSKQDFVFAGCGVVVLLFAVFPSWVSFDWRDSLSLLEVGFPIVGVAAPGFLAALFGLLSGQPISRRLFQGLDTLGIAGLLICFAGLCHLASIRYFSAVDGSPGLGFWLMWLPLVGLAVLLWSPTPLPFLLEQFAPYSGVQPGQWVAVPVGTTTIDGLAVPNDQWLKVEQIVGRVVSLASVEGLGYRIYDVPGMISHTGEVA